MIERVAARDVQYMPPLKKPRTARWMAESRGTAMMEVPIAALEHADKSRNVAPEGDAPPRRFAKRTRIPRLDFWRNERAIYERLPGSAAPSVVAVSMNFAPRHENMGERKFPSEVVQQAVPVITGDDQLLEFVSSKTDRITSKFIVLPPCSGVNPATYVVPAFAKGQIIMIEGSLRCGYVPEEGKRPQESVLETGDHMVLPGNEREVLLAANGRGSRSVGAKLKIFYFPDESQFEEDDNVLPVGA